MYQPCECRFCAISKGIYQYDDIDRPFASNDRFFSMASIGAIVKGWTLISPVRHDFSMRKHYGDILFHSILEETYSRLSQVYGKIVLFEHGANSSMSMTSCGTSHAHLHLVPSPVPLLSDEDGDATAWIKCSANDIASIAGDREYLFYSDLFGGFSSNLLMGNLQILQAPTSQYFRKIIADRYGLKDMYDYKSYPFLDNARDTRASYVSNR